MENNRDRFIFDDMFLDPIVEKALRLKRKQPKTSLAMIRAANALEGADIPGAVDLIVSLGGGRKGAELRNNTVEVDGDVWGRGTHCEAISGPFSIFNAVVYIFLEKR